MVSLSHKKLDDIIARSKQAIDEARTEKAQKRAKAERWRKCSSEETRLTSWPVHKCYLEQAQQHGMQVPFWQAKEKKQAKVFVQKVGSDANAIAIIKYIFENWERLKRQWRIEGNPTIGIILTFGVGLIDKAVEAVQVQPDNRPKREWHIRT